jgi:hypothetical protein
LCDALGNSYEFYAYPVNVNDSKSICIGFRPIRTTDSTKSDCRFETVCNTQELASYLPFGILSFLILTQSEEHSRLMNVLKDSHVFKNNDKGVDAIDTLGKKIRTYFLEESDTTAE